MGSQMGPLLVATLALSIASCGIEADVPDEREGPQISKAAVIERADAICARDQARVSSRLANLANRAEPRRPERIGTIIAPILEVNLAAIRSGTKRIESLGRPTTDADALDEYLDERTTAANALDAALKAAREQDMTKLSAALRVFQRNQAADAAVTFGFKVCALGDGRVEPRTAG